MGKVLVCFHAVTIQHPGRATRSIDHDTHGHRLGQDKVQAGFEGSQEARALEVLGLLRGVQIYEPNEVRIKTSRSGDHKRQKTDITRKQ